MWDFSVNRHAYPILIDMASCPRKSCINIYSHCVLHRMKRTLLGVWSRQNTSFLGVLLSLALQLEHIEGSKPTQEQVLENQHGNDSFENITRSLVLWKNSGESQRALRGYPWEGVKKFSTSPTFQPTHSLTNTGSLSPGAPTTDAWRTRREGEEHRILGHPDVSDVYITIIQNP